MARARSRWIDVATAALFSAAIAAPSVDLALRPAWKRSPELVEQRSPAPLPSRPRTWRELGHWPRVAEAWFEDAFGLRDVLLRLRALELYFVFGVPPTTQVVRGQGDWLFYAGENALDATRGVRTWDEDDLEAWRLLLESRRDACAALGARYLFVLAPNKETIYPDFVAPRFNRVGPTFREELLFWLALHSDVPVLDLTPALQRERAGRDDSDPLYTPRGTHWTGHGQWASLCALLERLRSDGFELPDLPEARLRLQESGDAQESLARRMNLHDLLPDRDWVWLVREESRASRLVHFEPDLVGSRWISERSDGRGPHVYLLHDSFGPYLRVLLAESCARLVCLWGFVLDPERVAEEQPDLVLDLRVERALVEQDPRELMGERVPSDPERFERAARVLLSLDPRAPDTALEAVDCAAHAELLVDGSVCVRVEHGDPKGHLAAETLDLSDAPVVFLDLDFESPEASTLQLVWTDVETPDRSSFHRRETRAGRQRLTLRLSLGAERGRLQVRLGREAGVYRLFALELRAP